MVNMLLPLEGGGIVVLSEGGGIVVLLEGCCIGTDGDITYPSRNGAQTG